MKLSCKSCAYGSAVLAWLIVIAIATSREGDLSGQQLAFSLMMLYTFYYAGSRYCTGTANIGYAVVSREMSRAARIFFDTAMGLSSAYLLYSVLF
jgi:hypothetical protein